MASTGQVPQDLGVRRPYTTRQPPIGSDVGRPGRCRSRVLTSQVLNECSVRRALLPSQPPPWIGHHQPAVARTSCQANGGSGPWLSRVGARCRSDGQSVSPARSPHPARASARTGRSACLSRLVRPRGGNCRVRRPGSWLPCPPARRPAWSCCCARSWCIGGLGYRSPAATVSPSVRWCQGNRGRCGLRHARAVAGHSRADLHPPPLKAGALARTG